MVFICDKMFPALDFGAKIPPSWQVRKLFIFNVFSSLWKFFKSIISISLSSFFFFLFFPFVFNNTIKLIYSSGQIFLKAINKATKAMSKDVFLMPPRLLTLSKHLTFRKIFPWTHSSLELLQQSGSEFYFLLMLEIPGRFLYHVNSGIAKKREINLLFLKVQILIRVWRWIGIIMLLMLSKFKRIK